MAAALQAATHTADFTGMIPIAPGSASVIITAGQTEKKRPSVDLIAAPPVKTEVSMGDTKNLVSFANAVSTGSDHAPELPYASPGLRKVNAVIDKITPDTVIIHCLLQSKTLNLRLPPSLIPPELLSYGQPVTISLQTEAGIRAPLIERREISAQEAFDDQAKLDSWLNSI